MGEAKTDIEALPAEEAGDTADGYVVLKKHEEPEEKGEEGKGKEEGQADEESSKNEK